MQGRERQGHSAAGRMRDRACGYDNDMDLDALLDRLGDDHCARSALPVALQPIADEALLHGLVIEDCRGRLVRL